VGHDGVVYVLVGSRLLIISATSVDEISVPSAPSLETFFTPGQGKKCPALASGKHVLIVSKTKLLIINCHTKETREVDDSRWCLCASDGPKVYLADKDGSVHMAEHPLSSPSFPGSTKLVCTCSGSCNAVDANCVEKVEDFVKEPAYMMRPRDSGSVITAMAAASGKVYFCKGHGLLSAVDGRIEEILKDERSSKSFAFPSALFWQSDVAFSQCADGIRKLFHGEVTLALAAGDMVLDGDRGSPQPYPKDLIGVDADFCYFLVERDFHTGQALRRWPHQVPPLPQMPTVQPPPDGATEMKIMAKKGAGPYIRYAEGMLKGEAKEGEAKIDPVHHLRITALGNAIDVAATVAVSVKSSGLAGISRIQTSYLTMEGERAGSVPQIFIDLEKQ